MGTLSIHPPKTYKPFASRVNVPSISYKKYPGPMAGNAKELADRAVCGGSNVNMRGVNSPGKVSAGKKK